MTRPSPATTPPPLRTVLFVTATTAADIPCPPDYPAALLPLGHCSFIEHALAQLASAGVRQLDLVVSPRPEELRRLLGDGERWGISLRWHLVKDIDAPYGILRTLGLEQSRRVLIGHAERWIAGEALAGLTVGEQVLMRTSDELGVAWSGWASIRPEPLIQFSPHGDEAALAAMLCEQGATLEVLEQAQFIQAGNAAQLLQAQRSALQGPFMAALPASWLRKSWGAHSPTALVQDGAIIEGPVLVGPGCMVCSGAHVGPFTVLSSDTVVSADSHVRNSLVLPHTYVGAGLELDQTIVQARQVQHLKLGVRTVLPVSEGLLMDLQQRAGVRTSWPARAMALLACLLLLPWLLLDAGLRRARGLSWRWQRRPVIVGLDPDSDQLLQQSLRCPLPPALGGRGLLAQYGGWLDVLEGRRSWFGARPRSPSEWYTLSRDWQLLLGSTPIGCLHAPAWSDSEAESLEARAAADVFFAVRRSRAENLRLLWTLVRNRLNARRRTPIR